MKNYFTLTFFFAAFYCFSLSAQPGKLISQAYYSFDTGTGVIMSADSFSIAYNSQLLPELYRNFAWNTSGIWELKGRSTDFQYDANGNQLSYTLQSGNDISGWTNTWRYSTTYNATNQELISKLEKWDGANWALNSLSEKVYDANGLLLSSGGASYRQLYTYNTEGLLETEASQYFSGGNWVNLTQEAYSYLPNSSLVETRTHLSWAAGNWTIDARDVFQYDANGNNTQQLTEFLDQNQWTPSFRLTMEYDANQNLFYWISGNWDGGNWIEDARQFNTYDQDNHFTSARLELLNGTAWEMATFGRLHYGALSATQHPGQVSFEVFPNPASGMFTLRTKQWLKVALFDAQGRLVESKILDPNTDHSVPTAHLAAGIYSLQSTGEDGKVHVKPLIIQR